MAVPFLLNPPGPALASSHDYGYVFNMTNFYDYINYTFEEYEEYEVVSSWPDGDGSSGKKGGLWFWFWSSSDLVYADPGFSSSSRIFAVAPPDICSHLTGGSGL